MSSSESSVTMAHLLTGDIVEIKVNRCPATVNDVKVGAARHFSHILPPQVVVLSRPDAKELSMQGTDDANINVPNNVSIIFREHDHENRSPIWSESFAAFAKAGDTAQMREMLLHTGDDTPNNSVRRTFFQACEDGNLAVLEAHVAAGIIWDCAIYDGVTQTALSLAARNEHLAVMQFLIEHGADVNLRGEYGATPLCDAAQYGKLDAIKVLVAHKAEVDKSDNIGDTPLAIACDENFRTIVRYLLNRGANPNSVNHNGWTPICVAAQESYLDIAEILIAHGADVNKGEIDGFPPLTVASHEGSEHVVRLIMESGADLNQSYCGGWTSLCAAIHNGHVSYAKQLLQHKADPNFPNGNGDTALCIAASRGCFPGAKLLLEYGADTMKTRKSDGLDPVQVAVQSGHAAVASFIWRMTLEQRAREKYQSETQNNCSSNEKCA